MARALWCSRIIFSIRANGWTALLVKKWSMRCSNLPMSLIVLGWHLKRFLLFTRLYLQRLVIYAEYCLIRLSVLTFFLLLFILDDNFEDPATIRSLNEYYYRAILYEFDLNRRSNTFLNKWKNVIFEFDFILNLKILIMLCFKNIAIGVFASFKRIASAKDRITNTKM